MTSNRKLKLLVSIYIILILSLSVLGLFGNQDRDAADLALKYFSKHDIQAGRSYFLYGISSVTIYRIVSILLLLFIAVKGYDKTLIKKISAKINCEILTTFIAFTTLFVLLTAVRLPFAIFSGFYRKKIFGLMNADFITWLSRYLSGAVISLLLTALIIAIMIVIIKSTKRYFFYIPAAFLLFSILFSFIYPRFITPLFYKMVRIENKALKGKITDLLRKNNITISDIYVIDKSRYSKNVNAYMTGIATDRRIYLYDTLLQNFTHAEILSIVAHELCHYLEEHMLIGIILGSLGILLSLPLFNLLSNIIFGRDIRTLTQGEGYVGLLILLIVFIFISKPVENSISRVFERRADIFSVTITKRPDSFIKMKTRLAQQNKSDLLPHPLYVWFYHNHPAVIDRIQLAEEYNKRYYLPKR